MMSVTMDIFQEWGKGVGNCYILLDKREWCLLILKCLFKGPMGGFGVSSLLEKQINCVNINTEVFSGMKLYL